MDKTSDRVIDTTLKEFMEVRFEETFDVLDLACGSGEYLQEQTNLFQGNNVNWFGVDASQYMLEKANEKAEGALLRHGYAEDLPYADDSFDYIASHFAFHHFIHKNYALDEIRRVLRKEGRFKLFNTSPQDMKAWWVYKYFPEAYSVDFERFWSKQRLFEELSDRQFDVQITMNYEVEELTVSDVAERFYNEENEDISILSILNDEDYFKGKKELEADLKLNPNKLIVSEYAEILCVADFGGRR